MPTTADRYNINALLVTRKTKRLGAARLHHRQVIEKRFPQAGRVPVRAYMNSEVQRRTEPTCRDPEEIIETTAHLP